MKFTYACDIHGDEYKYEKLLAEAIKQKIKYLVFGGDLFPKNCSDRYNEQKIFIEKFFDKYFTKLKKNNIKCICILGNDNLEQKIRLIFNIPVLFQIINIEFYDENKKYVGFVQHNKTISMWNRCTYNIDPEEFSNNSRFGMDINAMKNTQNNHFNRALEFYNDSFDSEKISNRFILIFSSLEAIFNLDSGDITEKISKYTAKLLAENNLELYNEIYSNIKKLYKKRCDYVHGSKINNIGELDEKLLRKYARRIIIAYWIIIMNTKKTAKEILKYLDSDEKLDIQVRIAITALNSNSFSEQQNKLISIVEEELKMNIPEQTKRNLLKNCD